MRCAPLITWRARARAGTGARGPAKKPERWFETMCAKRPSPTAVQYRYPTKPFRHCGGAVHSQRPMTLFWPPFVSRTARTRAILVSASPGFGLGLRSCLAACDLRLAPCEYTASSLRPDYIKECIASRDFHLPSTQAHNDVPIRLPPTKLHRVPSSTTAATSQ
jgi:hypothetical protein